MSDRFQKLIDLFGKLPGIGPRQATRLVLAMLNWPDASLKDFSNSIEQLKQGTAFCSQCFNLSDANLCGICSNPKRDNARIAVVEKVTDLASMEKTGVFTGVYHVLGGSINPVDGITPEQLKIPELVSRVRQYLRQTPNLEVILALGHHTQGDTTALYIRESLKPLSVKLTRLARGLAAGSTLEYVDEATLANALRDRR